MKRKSFLEWTAKQDANILNEMSRTARYGGREDDDKIPLSMIDRIIDNGIAEDEWEKPLHTLAKQWAAATGGTKELLGKKIEEAAERIRLAGNAPDRVQSIISRAMFGVSF
jgi:hypothetical protein